MKMLQDEVTSGASLSACPLCGSPSHHPVLTKSGFEIVRCCQCGFMYVCPIPTQEFLHRHYQNPAYFQGEEEQGYLDYTAMRKALLPHFSRRLRTIDAHISAKGRILDYGCADGYFLDLARKSGWQIDGVELAQPMRVKASDTLNIEIHASLDDVNHHQYDAITLWEVVEHLPDPIGTLREILNRLRPGGVLMLSTPNNAFWQAKDEPTNWIAFRPPSHLLFFTPATLKAALELAGFSDVEVHGVSPLPRLPGWFRHLTTPLQQSLANGTAQHWRTSLYIWRAIRFAGWGWHWITAQRDDVYTTLEAIAYRPAATEIEFRADGSGAG